MGLPDRQNTPGQPMDPIQALGIASGIASGLASVQPSYGISDTRNTAIPTTEDMNSGYQRHLLREGPFLIADYLAQNSSKSAAVFRRYDKLAIYRLITLSRELRTFEKRHDRCVESELDVERLGDTWFSEELGGKVLEYYKLLAAYSKVLHLEAPADRTVEAIDRFISTDKFHDHEKPWLGHQLKYRMEGDENRMTFTDLVSLYTPAENDYLSRFVDKFLYPLFLTPGSSKEAKYVNEQKMQKFVTFVGTIISIGFLVSAMWVLWRLDDHMVAKLGTVTGFVVAFAGWLGFLTTAQRKDVIAATAAYAAVLVVFVSQQSPTAVVAQGTGAAVTQS